MKVTSLTLKDEEIEKLKIFISKKGLKKVRPNNKYEMLRVKDEKISIVLYKSGKLVHNGSDESKGVVDAVLKREDLYDYILGSDETGKGEWYGPLVVVATALSPEDELKLRKLGVADSKTIKKSRLMEMAEKLRKMGFEHQSVVLLPETYNDLYSQFQRENKNLNDMMAWAHSAAIQKLLKKIQFKRAKVVIDKFDFKKTEERLSKLDRTKLKIIQKSGAESETAVAAASIIAKYIFENEVDKLNIKYGVDIKKSKPQDIKQDLLPEVAKIHFKNVGECL